LGWSRKSPKTQAWTVDAVTEVLGEHEGLRLDVCLELKRIDEFLLEVVDEARLGPGTAFNKTSRTQRVR
jgi:hypothetical protein